MEEVTVVITLYNKENYITKAVESVIDQTYPYWKLIIINDASTDGSMERLQPFLKNRRVKCISFNKNLGQTHALNYALTLIETPFFVQLDGDDWFAPETIETLVRKLSPHKTAALAYANHYVYWLDDRGTVAKKEPIILEQYTDKYDLLIKMNYALVPRMYRTDSVRDVGGWMVKEVGDMIAEDVQVVLRLASKYNWIWVNQFLYHRRRDPQNWRKFKETQPLRRKYRHDLYNQILREWGGEYSAEWIQQGDAYFLKGLVRNDRKKEGVDQWNIPL